MSNYNYSIIVGRLGNDPEIRYSAGGQAFGTVSVATSEKWKDKESGEQKERTDWHRIKVSGRLAEICGEYLRKGDLALFSGSLRTDKYTDKAGVEKYDTYVRANEMKMLGSKRDGEAKPEAKPKAAAPQRGGPPKPPPGEFEDDEIPFATNRGMW